MATGDILSCTVGTDGWYVDLVIEGFATGAAYAFGLDASNAPTASTPYLTVVSEGFDASGAATTITRTCHLTIVLRQPYPNDALAQETVSGGNLTVRVALSSPVYLPDNTGAGKSGTAPTFTAPAGFVTSGGNSSHAATAQAVTNSSTLAYPRVIANWSRPDRTRLTTASVTTSAVAFHGHPKAQKPVACVKFTATDAHGHTVTQTVTTPTVDLTAGDATPVVEYVATLNLTGFTDDDVITVNHVAYPWVGDSTSTIDTLAIADSEFTGQHPSQYYVLDTDGSRGYPMAVVDPTAADDSAGVVYGSDTSGNRSSATATPFKNLFMAVRKMYEYNLANNSRSNAQGGTIYLRSGTSAVMGGATSTPTTVSGNAWTWLTITPFPGVTDAVLTPSITTTDRAATVVGVRFKSCTFSRASDAYFTRGNSSTTARVLWEDCTFTDTRTSNTYQYCGQVAAHTWALRCSFTRVRAQTGNPVSFRGCTFPEGYDTAQMQRVMLGCSYTGSLTSPPASVITLPSQQSNDAEGAILACNRFTTPVDILSIFSLADPVSYGPAGVAIVQNLMEMLDPNSEPAMRVHGDSTSGLKTENVVIWHNTIVGQRCNLGYDTGNATVSCVHSNWSVGQNVMEYYANKGDTFTGGVGGANGMRTGNWSIDNGVRNFANKIRRGAFDQRFRGLYSAGGDNTSPATLGFVNDQSGDTVGSGYAAGGGNYRPAATSAYLVATAAAQMLPYDLDGSPRATSDSSGAYALVYAPYSPGGGGGGGVATSIKTLVKVGGVFRKIARTG